MVDFLSSGAGVFFGIWVPAWGNENDWVKEAIGQ
jgi:hypothetical protein